MGTTLAQAYVQVIPTTKGIKGMLGKELGNEGDSGGKTTGMKFTGAFKKAIVAAGIGTALAKTISEGAKLEQSIGGVRTLFGKKDAETVKRVSLKMRIRPCRYLRTTTWNRQHPFPRHCFSH